MFPERVADGATQAWGWVLQRILEQGQWIAPRGLRTKEVLASSVAFDMRFPVVCSLLRKLSYRFMAAEALWILAGDDTVEGIKPYNSRIAAFSDNWVKFFGAYGPPFVEQLPYIVAKLATDETSLQAVLTLWRPSPPVTKDVPCTISLQWLIRNNQLHCLVHMRSSDAWLGVPYDFFNFTMMTVRVACELQRCQTCHPAPLTLGTLYWRAGSSHLYEREINLAEAVAAEVLALIVRVPCEEETLNGVIARGMLGYEELVANLVEARQANRAPLLGLEPWEPSEGLPGLLPPPRPREG